MRKLDNGKLTTADKKTLTQQQNQMSKQIYQDKHNSAEQNTNPKSAVFRPMRRETGSTICRRENQLFDGRCRQAR